MRYAFLAIGSILALIHCKAQELVSEPIPNFVSIIQSSAITFVPLPRSLTIEESIKLSGDATMLSISFLKSEEQSPYKLNYSRRVFYSIPVWEIALIVYLLLGVSAVSHKMRRGNIDKSKGENSKSKLSSRPSTHENSHNKFEPLQSTPRLVVDRAEELQNVINSLLTSNDQMENLVTSRIEDVRKDLIHDRLHSMPVKELKRLSKNSIPTAELEASGLRSIGHLTNCSRYRLEAIRGIGPITAKRVFEAAHRAKDQVTDQSPVRFDMERRPLIQTKLLDEIFKLDLARREVETRRPTLEELFSLIAKDIPLARLECQPIRRFFSSRIRKDAARSAILRLNSLLNKGSTISLHENLRNIGDRLSKRGVRDDNVWKDYERRSAHYNALLAEVGKFDEDTESSAGFASSEIIAKIKEINLDNRLLKVNLRGYQAFGAKYALVQKHTILGDEMGLGKTIEALALICHLKRNGGAHFLVVCPASVMVNWEHEVFRHTHLKSFFRLHGNERDLLLVDWVSRGGLAVTTYDTLRSLDLPYGLTISALIIDEAHYVKNPSALRTIAVCEWLRQSDYSILMTGTPMENRVEEFQTLVNHVRPKTGLGIDLHNGYINPNAFRRSVSNVYLRRNQSDVLQELPEKIETEEWLILQGEAAVIYRRAVSRGNFMKMRRAAYLTKDPRKSPKLARLLEITNDAAERGLKIVVFSFFIEVINRINAALKPLSAGIITGSVSAVQRQKIIDQFTASKDPAVLVCQVQAGGVGLNIQAASVVILAEPQWKPSTEEQAIARCHRMGQVRRVEVHRLLTENSVDEHMMKLLRNKSVLFDAYARKSAMKEATPDAVDNSTRGAVGSDRELKSLIIAKERQRLGISPRIYNM